MVVDGVRPGRVERPDTPERLAEALQQAAAQGDAVVPVGGGRALGLGDPPERVDLALETTGLDRIIDLSQHDLTISVEAGATLEKVNGALAEVGQFLPIDPFNSPGHTIGGILAAALSGPLRLRYGSPRDFVIGLRVALPDGHLASSGGRVVKNVSGYDMGKLHQGALGSLGVIVAASFKTYPQPLADATVEATPADPWAEAARALALKQAPVALELTAEGRLLARFSGTAEGVARMTADLGWQPAPARVWEEHSRRGGEHWARLSVGPRRLPELVRQLPPGSRWWASPGIGTLHWAGPFEAGHLLRVRGDAERLGGSLVLMAAPAELKRQVGAWGAAPATLDVMRRLKQAFDPGRSLSPGRYPV